MTHVEVSVERSPLRFFLLVFALSIPFWLLGAVVDRLPRGVPEGLPASAFMAVCPLLAALLLVYRREGITGARELLKRILDHRRIRPKTWYLPALLLMPGILVFSYALMSILGAPLPQPRIPLAAVPLLFLVFFVSGIGEEVGWMGYALDPLQRRWTALTAAVVLGSVGAVWHLVPYLQAGNGPAWITGQCIFTVASRVLYVWLYRNAGSSLFAAILFHTMSNVATFSFPNGGSHYNPGIAAAITTLAAAAVTIGWGPQTLARFRYAQGLR